MSSSCSGSSAGSPPGSVGLIVTLDWSFSHSRDWGSPHIPEKLDLKAMLRHAPEAFIRPRWLLSWARAGGPPDLTVPNMAPPGGTAPAFFGAYGEWMQSTLPTWEDLRWLCEQWGGAVMLKGVMRSDDAKRAVDAGFTAISVSNHGGNNLDGTPASVRALPAIADAVGDQIEVLLDGGIRRGSDVVKALALGARAVMIGRPYLWGLAANGQAGVENVLDILRAGIDSALLGMGKSSVRDVGPEDLLIPPGFARGGRGSLRSRRLALATPCSPRACPANHRLRDTAPTATATRTAPLSQRFKRCSSSAI